MLLFLVTVVVLRLSLLQPAFVLSVCIVSAGGSCGGVVVVKWLLCCC